MCKKSLLSISVVLVLVVVNSVAFGYEENPTTIDGGPWLDQNDYSIVTGQPVIDGIISPGEWDDAEWINIGGNVYGGGTWPDCTPNDLTDVMWANMWSPETNLIYVVVQGTDTSHNFGTYVSWNTQDDLEVYVDAGESNLSGYNSDFRYGQHYFIGPDGIGGGWVYLADQPADALLPGGYAVNVNGDVITYEFAITPYQELDVGNPANSIIKNLQVGDLVGLDVCMSTADVAQQTTFMCEHSQPVGLWKDAGYMLDLTLIGVFVTAHNESPSDGQTDVAADVVLSWAPGEYAAFHDVYFGTDYDDVNDANTSDSTGIYRGRQNFDANSYDTNDYAADGLWPGKTYYWRIDEVNDACQPQPWKGDVWSFTVACDMVVASPIDFNDLVAFARQWLVEGGTQPQQGWCCGADLDHSGWVDFGDFASLGQDWLTQPLGPAYYVDFDSGNDNNNGTSTLTPWKHCPCDNNATGIAAATILQGGDTVIFKGGVHYRGEIKVNASGGLGVPIVFDGDTAQTWGSGKAVIDGSELLTSWTPCSSAEDCGGAAYWANMYKTTLPVGCDDVWSVNLMENDQLLAVAQGPTAPDPFFYDKTSSYNAVPLTDANSTSIVDASFFTQSDPNAWDGAYAHVWATGNQVYTSKVTGYSPSTHTIYFETLPNPPYPDRDTLYAMGNCVEVLDAAGEYVVNESSGEVYLWPYTTGDISSVGITVSVRRNGFDFNGKSNITLQGFKIIKFSAGFGNWASGAGIKNTTDGANNIIVRNNEVAYNRSMDKFAGVDLRGSTSEVTVENNYIHRNLRSRGLLTGGSNITFRNNILIKNGGTGIYMGGAHNVDVIGNSVLDHTGVHANGITAYQGSSDILILGNTVLRGNCALTTQDSDSITMAYNVLHTYGGGLCVADWTWDGLHCTNLHYYNNVIMNESPPALNTGGTGLIVTNNIINGWGGSGSNVTYNLYTALAWNQYPQYNWYLGTGEIIEQDKSKVFVNYANLDYHLKSTSPAKDAGIDVGYSEDLEGNPVPSGSAVDIGAYEYQQ